LKPYYEDELVQLFLGDCREVTEWLAADVLVTDPPYGRGWKQGQLHGRSGAVNSRWVTDAHGGIAGDEDTALRDEILAAWSARVAVVFGDLMLTPPPGNRQTCIYPKPPPAGLRGATGGFRRDAEGIYLLGPWPSGIGGRSSVITTNSPVQGNGGCQSRYGHPHAKPVDVMETLIAACPPGVIADPFAGSGSTLVAARNLGRRAIGIEIEERYCEKAALRLCQDVLITGTVG
jgi:site-specific DNA-methyltransferase (adenine-specific)